jgi:hypothetical protein
MVTEILRRLNATVWSAAYLATKWALKVYRHDIFLGLYFRFFTVKRLLGLQLRFFQGQRETL